MEGKYYEDTIKVIFSSLLGQNPNKNSTESKLKEFCQKTSSFMKAKKANLGDICAEIFIFYYKIIFYILFYYINNIVYICILI